MAMYMVVTRTDEMPDKSAFLWDFVTGAYPITEIDFWRYAGRVGTYHGGVNNAATGEPLQINLKFTDGAIVAFKPWMLERLENV